MHEDWDSFFGMSHYQRAFVDFFEDQLVQFNYDWKALVNHYLFEVETPLIFRILNGSKSAMCT
jgi:hypothetical protein